MSWQERHPLAWQEFSPFFLGLGDGPHKTNRPTAMANPTPANIAIFSMSMTLRNDRQEPTGDYRFHVTPRSSLPSGQPTFQLVQVLPESVPRILSRRPRPRTHRPWNTRGRMPDWTRGSRVHRFGNRGGRRWCAYGRTTTTTTGSERFWGYVDRSTRICLIKRRQIDDKFDHRGCGSDTIYHTTGIR